MLAAPRFRVALVLALLGPSLAHAFAAQVAEIPGGAFTMGDGTSTSGPVQGALKLQDVRVAGPARVDAVV
jgi:hypothetical protein